MMVKYMLIAVVGLIIGLSVSLKKPVSAIEETFNDQVTRITAELDSLGISIEEKDNVLKIRQNFLSSRLAYKKASLLVDYFFPVYRRAINGPDIRFAEDDNPDEIKEPHGFQVIERMLYSGSDTLDYAQLGHEVGLLSQIFGSMTGRDSGPKNFSNGLVFDAMTSGTIRLISLGITGFDSPLALYSIEESGATLEGMKDLLTIFHDTAALALVDGAIAYLSANKNFNAFDRLDFIRTYADPLYGQIVTSATQAGYLLPEERRPVDQKATSIFAAGFFNIHFFSPNQRYQMTPERVELGRHLFYDSILSVSRKRSCASCHDPSKAFSDGLPSAFSINNTSRLKRNTPTLLNAALQTRYFYDSRTSTLENQLNSVVHNSDEMEGSLKEAVKRISEHPSYTSSFKKAYAGDDRPVTEYNIANAISSYVRSLSKYDSRFDRYMRGNGTLTKKEKKGFNLFAGKAKCATCHYIPLFNGLVPPQFTETESEVIGVPAAKDLKDPVADDDEGKFLFTKSVVHKHAFKTPTLRNIALTAPYMHNGIYNTLEEVMDFYNKGGGAGTHTAFENETLPAEPLHLSKKEINAVIAFMRTLDDVKREP